MAEVTGNPSNPPIEYRAAPGQATQPAEWPAAETAPVERGAPAVPLGKQVISEFIGTFALVFVAVTTLYWFVSDMIATAENKELVVVLKAINCFGGILYHSCSILILWGWPMLAPRC